MISMKAHELKGAFIQLLVFITIVKKKKKGYTEGLSDQNRLQPKEWIGHPPYTRARSPKVQTQSHLRKEESLREVAVVCRTSATLWSSSLPWLEYKP